MELGAKVEILEDKLYNTLEVLKDLINIDQGIDNETTEWLVERINDIISD